MNFSERDLIQMRKDVERIRRHEESRRARAATEQPAGQPAGRPRVSLRARLRQVFASVFHRPKTSDESLAAIPEYIVTLLQVVQEQPKFKAWFLASEPLPPHLRNRQLQKLSFAFRIEDGASKIAEAFDRLQDPILFNSFCKALRDETETPP
jgi:hypothetical protein